ncbi:MAG: universal stress protein [Spirochaetia bacterium]|jgi:nucleotide-binding universal stress UspA family protein|nr:universal stress protein [Spirochaetia bacterium]
MDGPVNKIMVYVDGTEESITAAQYGICLARATGAEFYALYIVNTRALSDLVSAKIFLQAEEEEYKNDLELDADRYLNHIKQMARDKGVAVKTLKSSGSVNVEIKNKVNENEIDLLIIGELSKIRSRRDELYNETERAMRSVNCSVLIAKDEERVWTIYNQLV